MPSNEILQDVSRYYAAKVEQYGATAQGVDWNSPESQALRFAQLLKLCDRPQFSLNDIGCGYGAMLDYLVQQQYDWGRYSGFDIAAPMIQQAIARHPATPRCQFFSNLARLERQDYTVASGIFNVKLHHDTAAWELYIVETLTQLHQFSQHGFAFNVLTSYSDPEYRRADLYYADPCFWFDYCKRHFSRNVAILHDYSLYEFTMLIRK